MILFSLLSTVNKKEHKEYSHGCNEGGQSGLFTWIPFSPKMPLEEKLKVDRQMHNVQKKNYKLYKRTKDRILSLVIILV